eukprot:3589789-Alexandrium_andersonii.AAC.1
MELCHPLPPFCKGLCGISIGVRVARAENAWLHCSTVFGSALPRRCFFRSRAEDRPQAKHAVAQ